MGWKVVAVKNFELLAQKNEENSLRMSLARTSQSKWFWFWGNDQHIREGSDTILAEDRGASSSSMSVLLVRLKDTTFEEEKHITKSLSSRPSEMPKSFHFLDFTLRLSNIRTDTILFLGLPLMSNNHRAQHAFCPCYTH